MSEERNPMEVVSKNLVEDYVKQDDWRVNENANMAYSLQGLNNYIKEEVTKYYWMNYIYSPEVKQAHVDGRFHLHDSGSLSGYCMGLDLEDLLEVGYYGGPGKVRSNPPSHLSAALSQLNNLLFSVTGEVAGAVAVSNLDTLMAPFIYYDNLTKKQVKQALQEFIFNLNVPTRTGYQSPFSNCTLDFTVPKHMADKPVLVGGKRMDKTYKEFQKEMDLFNECLFEVMNEGDADGRIFSFPIPTVNVTKNFDWDNPRYKALWDNTAKYGQSYFCNYVSSDMDPADAMSMCPLPGYTRVLVKTRDTGSVRRVSLSELNKTLAKMNKDTVGILDDKGAFVQGRLVKLDPTPIYVFTLRNGVKVELGENHLQPVFGKGTVKAKDIAVGDWLPFAKRVSDFTTSGSYDFGYAIGAYAGDGSKDTSAIRYSLSNTDKDAVTEANLRKFWNNTLGYNVRTFIDGNLRTVDVYGKEVISIIERYISGDSALTKDVSNTIFDMSADFLEGFIAGYKDTDGSSEKRRLYTSSKELRRSLTHILSMLGYKYSITNVDNREGRLGTNPCYRVDYSSRPKYGDLYKEDGDYHYYQVVSVETKTNSDPLYCVELDTDNHLFQIAGGLVTHNCRLRIDLTELKRKGGLFGANPLTGSVSVCTINFPRLGYLHKNDEPGFFKELDELLLLAKEALETRRKYVELRTRGDFYPILKFYLRKTFARFQEYWKNHFSTIATVGMNECCMNMFGYSIGDERGREFALKVMNYLRNKAVEFQKETGHQYNIEQAPAEATSYRLAKIDKKKYPDIIVADNETVEKEGVAPFYTNSTQLPVNYTDDIFEMMDNQSAINALYTGGSVQHLYLGERVTDLESMKQLIKTVFSNYEIPYISITPTFSVCPVHGYLSGEHQYCPQCKTEKLHKINLEEERLKALLDIQQSKGDVL